MKKKYFFWLVWFLFYVFVFAYLLQNSFSYLDPDLGWHLQVGKEIIGNNHAPVYEKYTYTLSGQTWVDHEWLFNVLIYWLFENFGFIPLSVFFSLLMIFTLALLAFYVIKYHVRSEKGVFLIMALQFFGLKAMAPHLGVRMQEITLLLLLVLLIILDRFEHTKKSKILAWLPPLFLVWANLHGSFLIGLTVLAFWLFFKLAVTIIARLTAGKDSTDHDLNRRNWRHSLFWCLGALAATFLNPYGLGLYDFLSGYADNYYSKHITEWLPFYYLSIQHNQLFYCALVAGIFCILSITRFLKKDFKDLKKIRFDLLWSYVLILFFLWLALKSKRHF
ncbi:MAG: hypothetical protein MUC28_03395, partial [Planctomycetes bacterium]|nr:hypothetical protein [Planctomycetota bacterium]